MPLDDNFTGTIEENTGTAKIIVQYKNGKKHGVAQYISATGDVLSEIEYESDKINGNVVQYYPSGATLSNMEYKYGQLDGTARTFYENGIMQMQVEYREGKLDGRYETYDEFGDKVEICTYRKGLKQGTDTLYYPKSHGGGVYETSSYIDGLLDGDKISFDPKGNATERTPYKKGRAQQYPMNFRIDTL